MAVSSAKRLAKGPSAKRPSDSRVTMTELVLPQHTNALGTIFGGVIMSWCDIAAAIAAQRHSGRTVVTAAIDELHFLRPIRKGFVVNIDAQITAVHRSSCEVRVRVQGENPRTGHVSHTAESFLTFVALDDNGESVEMPPLKPVTREEKLLEAQARVRRAQRQKLREKLQRMNPDGRR